MNFLLLIAPVYLFFSYYIADKLGRKRHINFDYSFVISLTLTPIVGYLITVLTNEKDKPFYKGNVFKITLAVLSVIFFIGSLFSLINLISDDNGLARSKSNYLEKVIITCLYTFGSVVLAYYCTFYDVKNEIQNND